jgi:hypothetical protein
MVSFAGKLAIYSSTIHSHLPNGSHQLPKCLNLRITCSTDTFPLMLIIYVHFQDALTNVISVLSVYPGVDGEDIIADTSGRRYVPYGNLLDS